MFFVEYGSDIVSNDHPANTQAQPKSKFTSFIQMANAQTLSAIVSLDKVTREERPQNTDDVLRNKTNLAIDDANMEAFYAILDAEISVGSPSNDTRVVSELTNSTMPSEETQKALRTLQDFLTRDFSVLLRPDEHSIMKATLDYLTNLPAEDGHGISVEIRSLIIQISRHFTRWSVDYTHEGKKIESTTAKLVKSGELEEGLEANKTLFKEVVYLENELCNELAYLEERKRELEEQINAVRASISASQAAKNMAASTKKEIFGKAMTLKAERDELRKQVPSLRDEKELAEKIQANIRAEWSNLGEKFNNSLNHKE